MPSTRAWAGAKWWRFDFHTHTPGSSDYGQGKDAASLRRITPREWLLGFMKAGIDCVAVTDHNSGAWIDLLKAALLELDQERPDGYRRLALFPGVEITVSGGVHLLGVFDSSVSTQTIVSLLGACGIFQQGGTDTCTSKTFSDVVFEITKLNGVAIPAHVDRPKGLFEEVEGVTLAQALKSPELLAIEVCDPAYPKPTLYSDLKCSLTEVVGSDAHHPEDFGRRYTWVKMEEPSLEALRLALHDGGDGVIRGTPTANDTPNDVDHRFFVTRLEVRNGAKAGRGPDPLSISFSPWLSSIIGGRGSGKSSIFDYLRLAFAQTIHLPEKIQKDFDAFRQVAAGRGKLGMLRNDTSIRVEMQKDGREIALEWHYPASWREYEKDSSGNWRLLGSPGNEETIRSRFPVTLISQRQLYEMTEDPRAVLEFLDRFVAKQQWTEERDALTQAWLASRKQQRQLEIQLGAAHNIRPELKDIEAKLALYESPENKTLLEAYRKHTQAQSHFKDGYEALSARLGSIDPAILSLDPAIEDFATLEDIDQESRAKLLAMTDGVRAALTKIIQAVADARNSVSHALDLLASVPWSEQVQELRTRYSEFERKTQEGGSPLYDYAQLVQRKEELERRVRAVADLEKKLDEQTKISNSLRAKYYLHEMQLRSMRQEVLQRWRDSSTEEGIRVELVPLGDTSNAESSLRVLLRKTGSEFAKDIFRQEDGQPAAGIIAELMAAPQLDRWNCLRTLSDRLLKADPAVLDARFARHLDQLRQQTPEDLDRILIWVPEDKVELKIVRNGREEDVEAGSAGQRTAGMLALLALGTRAPLFVDQPEDDLDTRLISDVVVTAFRKIKASNQVVVITHNPNIPVNGAAELIAEMRYAAGQIRCREQGALQRNSIRAAVCEVMEGGRDALNARYFRIARALRT